LYLYLYPLAAIAGLSMGGMQALNIAFGRLGDYG
jgi:hypothetical protein